MNFIYFLIVFINILDVMYVICGSVRLNQISDTNVQCPNCKCGVTNKKQRIVGGNATKIHEFPWIVGISKNGEYHCSGALISRKHVLTAAHCIYGFRLRDLRVIFADHDRNSVNRFRNIIVKTISKAIKHEHYDPGTYNNDIAVVQIDGDIDFSEKISPICLPNDNFNQYYGRNGIVAGWGHTKEKGTASPVLQKVTVPIWSKTDCYTKSLYGEHKLSENMFCAGYPHGSIDACQGDSGGPFQMGNKYGNIELVGIVSWGRGCGRPNLPGVYTKVSNYLDWIDAAVHS